MVMQYNRSKVTARLRSRRLAIELTAITLCLVAIAALFISQYRQDNPPVAHSAQHHTTKSHVMTPVHTNEKKETGVVTGHSSITTSDGTKVEVMDGPPMDNDTISEIGTYTVKKGDTLWDLSEAIYGDGSKWTTLYEANRDMFTKDDARNVKDPGHWIHIGQVIHILPADSLSDH